MQQYQRAFVHAGMLNDNDEYVQGSAIDPERRAQEPAFGGQTGRITSSPECSARRLEFQLQTYTTRRWQREPLILIMSLFTRNAVTFPATGTSNVERQTNKFINLKCPVIPTKGIWYKDVRVCLTQLISGNTSGSFTLARLVEISCICDGAPKRK